jgi:uncharacterized protein (DUF2252 family)
MNGRFEWLRTWTPPADRDPLAILHQAAQGRDEAVVKQRNQSMADGDVFTFLRGAAGVMAADLGAAKDQTTGVDVDILGDAHLGNFGMYGSPERVRVFDVNDFDEAGPGPWEWDVCRLAASAIVVERDHKTPKKEQIATARAALTAYASTAAALTAGRLVDRWFTITRCDAPVCHDLADLKASRRTLSRAAKLLVADPKRTQEKTVEALVTDGEFNVLPNKQGPVTPTRADEIHEAFKHYRESVSPGLHRILDGYRPTAVCWRSVGQGSLGLRNYLLLIAGKRAGDAMILQIKESTPSELAFGLGPRESTHEGRRVVELQRSMQGTSDPLLGWTSIGDEQYYVRQFRDMKSAPELTRLGHRDRVTYARLCGTTLARAHARTIEGGSIAKISARIGDGLEFTDAMVEFARTYATVSKADQTLFRRDVSS